MDELELELRKCFLEEAVASIEEAEQYFLDLEANPSDPVILDKIFRLAHNIKGTSRAVGYGAIAEFTHELESLLLYLKTGEVQITEKIVTLLLESNDKIKDLVDLLHTDIEADLDCADITLRVKNLLSEISQESNEGEVSEDLSEFSVKKESVHLVEPTSSQGKAEEETESLLIPEDEKLDQAIRKSVKRQQNEIVDNALRAEELEAEKKSVQTIELVLDQESISSEEVGVSGDTRDSVRERIRSKKNIVEETVRVKLGDLEKLNNFVGELVILQSVLNAQRNEHTSKLMWDSLVQLNKISKEIQGISMGLRMIPVKQTFLKMQRIVRDVSKRLGKSVHLQMYGEETAVDKTVLELLADPLSHLIRNAIDHGIESPEERSELGKSKNGNVSIAATHEGDQLVIVIQDDGRGVDSERLVKKALDKGISLPEVMTEQDKLNLVFKPGLSIKDTATEISGRGIGMDVVRANIRSLQGDATIYSERGYGTQFKINLPLTLAIIDGMVATVVNEKYVIPMSQINETVHLETKHINDAAGIGKVYNLRGESLPLIDLSGLLGRRQNLVNEEEKITSSYEWSGTDDCDGGIAIIINGNQTKCAVRVDKVLGLQQVVIKKLGAEVRERAGLTGSAILGDGLPAIIVDLHELVGGRDSVAFNWKESA